MQTSLVNNLRILKIKNARFSGYCFYMKPNIWLKVIPSYIVSNTDQRGAFYMFYLLEIERKREKKVAYFRKY